MSTELALVPMADLERMAAAFAASKLFGAKTKEEALSLMLVAQAEGVHPASAARDYDIIQGKGAKKAEAMLRDFLRAGGKVEWHALNDSIADATFSHQQGGTVRITWDMARVSKAKISNAAMYDKYPRQMLRSRCVSEGVRTVCPLATGGMYTPEDIQSIDPADAAAIDGTVTAKTIAMPQSKSKPVTVDPETGDIVPESASVAHAPKSPPPNGNVGGAASDAGDNAPTSKPRSPSQARLLAVKLKNANLTVLDFEAAYPKWSIEAKEGRELLPMPEVNGVIKWLEQHAKE